MRQKDNCWNCQIKKNLWESLTKRAWSAGACPWWRSLKGQGKSPTHVHGWFAAMQTREGIQNVSFVHYGMAEPRSWRTKRVRPENWSTWTENRMARFRISCFLLIATRLRSRPPSAGRYSSHIFWSILALQPRPRSLTIRPRPRPWIRTVPGSGALRRRRMTSLTAPCLDSDFGD